MEAKQVDEFTEEKDRLECAYRLGRINHALMDIPEAIYYYNYSIAFGINAPYFYACNAALQCGLIYEKQQDYKEAGRYFELCIKMYPEEYRTSLHQKAKAGLNRIADKREMLEGRL